MSPTEVIVHVPRPVTPGRVILLYREHDMACNVPRVGISLESGKFDMVVRKLSVSGPKDDENLYLSLCPEVVMNGWFWKWPERT